jgi:ribosomal protein S18 acetylase RimI-like enzyme
MPRTGASQPDLRTRPAAVADARVAARLHAQGIDQGFLSVLGPGFLGRLYRRICLDPGSFLIVATDGVRTGPDAVVGFVAGSVDVPALYRSFVWRDGVMAAVPTLGHLVTHWRRVLETLRHGSSDGAGTGRGAELLAIAVDVQARGRGAGGTLVTAFTDELARRELDAAYVVVGADNQTAVGLYERAGFVAGERFELHPGTESLLMQWERGDRSALPPTPGGSEP